MTFHTARFQRFFIDLLRKARKLTSWDAPSPIPTTSTVVVLSLIQPLFPERSARARWLLDGQ
jgi:hypothetical protein